MIEHVVAMRFTDPADAAPARDKLQSMVGVVPEIASMAVHLADPESPTGHHLLMHTTHTDEAALAGYQQHPNHLEVAGWLRGHLADRAVVDWRS